MFYYHSFENERENKQIAFSKFNAFLLSDDCLYERYKRFIKDKCVCSQNVVAFLKELIENEEGIKVKEKSVSCDEILLRLDKIENLLENILSKQQKNKLVKMNEKGRKIGSKNKMNKGIQ